MRSKHFFLRLTNNSVYWKFRVPFFFKMKHVSRIFSVLRAQSSKTQTESMKVHSINVRWLLAYFMLSPPLARYGQSKQQSSNHSSSP